MALSYFSLEDMPKTSSGKVQRSACKTKFLESSLNVWQQWYLDDLGKSDVTGLFQRYTNPTTYLKMLSAIARGKMRRTLSFIIQHFSFNISQWL